MTPFASALYPGHVMHHRSRPREHRLTYRMWSMLIDLDELDALDRRLKLFSVGRFNLVSFRPRDRRDGSGEIRARVEGIDMIFFGPGDFSHGIGRPGEMNDPAVVDARKRVADAARRHGKFAGTVGSLDNLDSLVNLGYQFVNLSADVTTLASTFGHVAHTFSQRQQKPH